MDSDARSKTVTVRRKQRSKTGCLTCRTRKVKCDEARPVCAHCITHRFTCDWPTTPAAIVGSCSTKSGFAAEPRSSGRHPSAGAVSRFAIGSDGPSDQRRQTAMPSRRRAWPLPSLPANINTASEVQCANSLVLTRLDRYLLSFFPYTTFFGFYDYGDRSSMWYLSNELSGSSSTVMSMVLAISGSEMCKQGLRATSIAASDDHRQDDLGLHYYSTGLRQLYGGLAHFPAGSNETSEVEVLVVSIFLMLNYEILFPRDAAALRIKMHLRGLWALVSTHSLFQRLYHDDRVIGVSKSRTEAACVSLSCQIVLWSIYLDISMISMGASDSLLKRLSRSSIPVFDRRHLCSTARRSNLRLWREKYSTAQQLRDKELYRMIEFGFDALTLRFRIWDLRTNGPDGQEENIAAARLLDELLWVKEEYSDLVQSAVEATSWGPEIEVVVRITAIYWATILFYCRMLDCIRVDVTLRETALSNLTRLLYRHYQHESEGRRQVRIVWPTFIAAIETRDAIHRNWFMQKLAAVGDITSESYWLWKIAEGITEKQDVAGGAQVDLATYMNHPCEA
ncbi:hypothetical protein BX600DRAFT_466969 [Xylariales sp. PMI_506]|nr:hypothetical protein BX600DRAFT_466969 [Xylariales sp. PMI_506]